VLIYSVVVRVDFIIFLSCNLKTIKIEKKHFKKASSLHGRNSTLINLLIIENLMYGPEGNS